MSRFNQAKKHSQKTKFLLQTKTNSKNLFFDKTQRNFETQCRKLINNLFSKAIVYAKIKFQRQRTKKDS